MIGLGRLGLSIALCFEKAGWDVLGVDISAPRVEAVNARELKSREPMVERYLRDSKRIHATSDLGKALEFSNIIYISVATPSSCTDAISPVGLGKLLLELNTKYQIKNKHLVLCSTIAPGYIEDVAKPLLDGCENVTISYIPDGAVPISYGDLITGITQPAMILIGEGSTEAGNVLEAAHRSIITNNPRICRMNTTSAEITKLALAAISASRIALTNYFCHVANARQGADADAILKCIGSDPRFGDSFFVRGYGFGGPCIPRDMRALAQFGKSHSIEPTIIDALFESNDQHTEMIASKILQGIGSGSERKVVLSDVAFKERAVTDVIDESRKLALASLLVQKGVQVTIKDKEAVINEVRKLYGKKFSYEISLDTPADELIIVQDEFNNKKMRMDELK